MKRDFETEMIPLTCAILADYGDGVSERVIDKLELEGQPERAEVKALIDELFRILFPGFFSEKEKFYSRTNRRQHMTIIIEETAYRLRDQIQIALRFHEDMKNALESEIHEEASRITMEFMKRIPKIREALEMDMQAGFDGDPAAFYREEIILSYPGFYAIAVNRLAHELYLLKVPLIPRIMTEHAHSLTGIDIHPGATIGKYFFIDHGTGVVVGETTVIGDYVKLYQSVTLGALSTRGGQSLRGTRRHPTIEDNVTIYSGASILGGETVIGHDSVVGSNAFITKSIAPGTRVSIKNQELVFKNKSVSKTGTEGFDDDPGQDDSWYYII